MVDERSRARRDVSESLATVAATGRSRRRRRSVSAAALISAVSRARISGWPSLTASTRRGSTSVNDVSARSVS